jgi:UDP-N-acetylglucosamine 2-epimerase (hydrolysing)
MKKILFLTGTRADFGKLKSLIHSIEKLNDIDYSIFATGMHMLTKYGYTYIEISRHGFKNLHPYINQSSNDRQDQILAKTIIGLSDYVQEYKPAAIVIHGDRIEALAGAIVGITNDILVIHIEGGEVSGAIDESIRHSVSKLSHVHLVSNEIAKNRLIQLGELNDSIHIIGSPDIDIMLSDNLPSIREVKDHYNINYSDYSIVLYHPDGLDMSTIENNTKILIDALLKSGNKYIVVYPNNDPGSDIIISQYSRLLDNDKFKIFPSIRFEYFLILLKYSQFIIGNSSAGIREAPLYGLCSINLGARQNNRGKSASIINTNFDIDQILNAIDFSKKNRFQKFYEFGNGESDKKFANLINSNDIWSISRQKYFKDLFDININ